MSHRNWLLIGLLGWAAVGCSGGAALPQSVPTYQVRVLNVYPHDPGAFCQGLVVEGNVLYEGTGQYGNSTLRRVDLETGKVVSQVNLPQQYFGEGVALFQNRLYQLTWKERVCFVYDKQTLKAVASARYTGEGWGLAADDQVLYLSQGTSTIRVMDPRTFKEVRRMRVKDGRRYVDDINELEYVDGKLLANIWYLDKIAEIDPATGKLLAWIDCSRVNPGRSNREHVLNGIAYDRQSGRLFITGKNWKHLYEIEILRSE